ncbi:hypothetical protein Q0S64_27515, partial [Escherichia coli O2:H6]
RHSSCDTIEHQGAFPGKRMLMTGNSLIRDRRRATKLLRVSANQQTKGMVCVASSTRNALKSSLTT